MSTINKEWKKYLKEHGYYAVFFSLQPKTPPSLMELSDWMKGDGPKYTGWSPFWWPTRDGIAPEIINQTTYECIHDGTGAVGHIERWQASTTGQFTIIRAFDTVDEKAGKQLELTLPAWRVSELLLYAGRMATRFASETIDFTLRYEGLSNRVLSTQSSQNRMLFEKYTTRASRYEKRVSLNSCDIESGVVEMTDNLIRGLFELFQFDLPKSLCEEEIGKMKSNRF